MKNHDEIEFSRKTYIVCCSLELICSYCTWSSLFKSGPTKSREWTPCHKVLTLPQSTCTLCQFSLSEHECYNLVFWYLILYLTCDMTFLILARITSDHSMVQEKMARQKPPSMRKTEKTDWIDSSRSSAAGFVSKMMTSSPLWTLISYVRWMIPTVQTFQSYSLVLMIYFYLIPYHPKPTITFHTERSHCIHVTLSMFWLIFKFCCWTVNRHDFSPPISIDVSPYYYLS